MNKLISGVWLLIILVWLAGCDLPQPADSGGDISSGSITGPTATIVTQAGVPTPTASGGAGFIPEPEWLGRKYALPPAAVQASAIVRLEPASTTLNVGGSAAFQIIIDNVTDLVGADVTLQFNPAILQVQDANANPDDGIQIEPGSFPSPEFIVRNVVTNTVGSINYTISDLAPFQPVSGSGVLAIINFQGAGQGSTDINISEAILVNSQIQSIPVNTQPAVVSVGLGTALPPTATSPLPATATSTLVPGTTPTFTPIVVATFTPLPPTPTFTPSPTFTPPPPPTPTATNTPVAPQVCIPPDATVGFCYRVQIGENLYSLGQKFNMNPRFISLVNDLNPPDYVYPQQILFMPQQYGHGPNIYITQAGDTLAKIEQDCKLEPNIVAQVNGLPKDATVVSGTPLIIPRPPYPPPSRYPYAPGHVWPPPPGACTY